MKKGFIFVLFAQLALFTFGQRDIQYSQMLMNNVYSNPAASGFSEDFEVALFGRTQWQGIDGAPRSCIMSVSKYSPDLRSSFGLTFSADQIGITQSTLNAKALYAYHVVLERCMMSFGVAAGFMRTFFDPNAHIWEDPTDELAGSEAIIKTKPDFNLGVELNTFSGFKFGCSMIHMGKSRPRDNTFAPHEHFIAYVEQVFNLNSYLEFFPSVIYMRGNSLNMFDINAQFRFFKNYWVNLAVRPHNAYSLAVGFQIDKYRIGYAYDMPMPNSVVSRLNAHELMLSASL